MSCMSDLNVLDHPPNMLSVVQKLPQYLQNKWRDNVGEMRRNSNHLRNLTDQIPKYRSDLDIGILIGSNCSKALEPLEVAPVKGSGLFTTRLRHVPFVHYTCTGVHV